MAKKTTCPEGQIKREGYSYTRPEIDFPEKKITRKTKSGDVITYTRDAYTTPEMSIKVDSTCIPDVGKLGKTPPSKQVIGSVEKGGLRQYFLPSEKFEKRKLFENADMGDCVTAGIVARKLGVDSYQKFQIKFNNLKVWFGNTNPKLVETVERCRIQALAGYDPKHAVPKGHQPLSANEANALHTHSVKIVPSIEGKVKDLIDAEKQKL